MYIELEAESKLQPYVSFDWRLIAERGLRCYGHFHKCHHESRTVASCEISFLLKMANEELKLDPIQVQDITLGHTKVSASSATRRAGQFKCVGAIRKAGFLSVKKWILKRHQSIELARKQGWKRYWVCLRGTALLFHAVIDKKDALPEDANNRTDLLSWVHSNCGSQSHTATNLWKNADSFKDTTKDSIPQDMSQCYIEREPRHLIIIEGSIAQPIPEHPKRDYVFCLSTTFGDAYLFQSSCQLESDNWISAIHNACAASLARDRTRDEAIKLFETKIKHLELEAEKKLFLRQRLESRLTSMCSISHIHSLASNQDTKGSTDKDTMRSLLLRLSQQLLSLDGYIEQVHCEIYQLRCYLASCGAQHIFYQQNIHEGASSSYLSIDLPHPKSLLMHVSKPTKLLLIKLGVFTVSSFHAYLHARQGSAQTILDKISQSSQQSPVDQSPIKLQVMSQSISETLFNQTQNTELEKDTEKLIDLSNLKVISVKISKKLLPSIIEVDLYNIKTFDNESDDRYSIHEEGDFILVNLKIHFNSSSMSIVKHILKILNPNLAELEFLNYYLCFDITKSNEICAKQQDRARSLYVTKRNETLNDWLQFEHLELLEKIIFKLELSRSQMDEESSPFGISIGAQLFETKHEKLLNVFCSYIEWGSVADKSGLKDEDEFLLINGTPVIDLDMMFIECIIHDETKLKLVVRSSRADAPSNATLLERSSWKPSGKDEDFTKNSSSQVRDANIEKSGRLTELGAGSQLISDEYISSLVCPPPPAQSSAFLRTDSNLLRQKSDMTAENSRHHLKFDHLQNNDIRKVHSTHNSKVANTEEGVMIKSQFNLNSYYPDNHLIPADDIEKSVQTLTINSGKVVKNNVDLANQLIKKTEQLTQLLGRALVESWGDADKDQSLNDHSSVETKSNSSSVERLKKSIFELLETEYAYIKHLETISDHYMNPLDEVDFLSIPNLKQLGRIIVNLTTFQKKFFLNLTKDIFEKCNISMSIQFNDDSEELNRIVQLIDSYRSIEDFNHILESIAKTFVDQAERFKIYAAYCAAYSGLQKIIHPKRVMRSNLHSAGISSIPSALDTFLGSNGLAVSSTSGPQYKELLKPLGSFMVSGNEFATQMRQLNEFLGNLDSSSSSVSMSLPKSSASEHKASSSQKKLIKSPQISFRKNVHQQNFESYLIKPIQRIVKYPMLLNSIAISAQELEALENLSDELQAAVKQMESIAAHVNDTQRVHDEFGMIFDHIERQFLDLHGYLYKVGPSSSTSASPHQPPINLSIEHLLYFGKVDWLNINEFASKLKKETNLVQILFVFNSCVVFICKEQVRSSTKKKLPTTNPSKNHGRAAGVASKAFQTVSTDLNSIIRYQSLIPVSEVQVRSVPVASAQQSKPERFQWELFRCSSFNSNSSLLTKSNKSNNSGKVYLLASSSNEERNMFLRKIRLIIRESVRNMNIPLARSPSSKSLTPKKMSSTSSETNTNSSCSQSASLNQVCLHGLNSKDISENCEFANKVESRYTTRIQVNI